MFTWSQFRIGRRVIITSVVMLAILVGIFPAIVSAATEPTPDASACFDSDPFDSIDPAWVTDRYEPAGFESVAFDGDNRLRITIDNAQASINRPAGQKSMFYNTQGRQLPAMVPDSWTVAADVYISEDMLTGNNLRRTDIWARTGQIGTENDVNYFIFGVKRFDNSDAFNPNAADPTTAWRVWDADTTSGWVEVGAPAQTGWYHLEIKGNDTQVEYRIDGALVYTDTTVNPLYPDLTSIIVQAYNFSEDNASNSGQDYQVYWDNVFTGEKCVIPANVSLVADSDEVCGAATVDINFDKVENLYGYEFKVSYDHARVTAEGAFDNNWFDTSLGSSPGPAWSAKCADGICRFASTMTAPNGAAVNDGGTVGTIDLGALTPGPFDIVIYDVILSDIDGFIIPAEVTTLPLSFTACGVATISGKVSLQGRLTPIDAGTVKLIGSAGFGPYEVNFSAADGSYTIPNVLYQLGGTTYDFQAAHGLYLGNEKTQAVNGNLTGQNTRLLGGDANNSGIVELLDLSCIGGDFGGPPSDCMGAGSSDINADTKVNIQDLAIAGGNFYKETYQPW